MAIPEKNGCLLAAVVASLTLNNVSAASNVEYVSPEAGFASVENCAYSIDCEVKNELAGPAGSA